MKNNRISSFQKINALHAFPTEIPPSHTQSNQHDNFLFLVTKPNENNSVINFKDLKSSIVNDTVSLTGDQLIRGKKIFADDCSFNGKLFTKEIIDTTQEGDISGYNFIGEQIYFNKVGIGNKFSAGQSDPQASLEVDGGIHSEGNFISEGSGIFSGSFSSNFLNVDDQANIGGDLTSSGNIFCGGNLLAEGDLYLSGILKSNQHEGYIEISSDYLRIAADDSNYLNINSGIDVIISGENKFSIDNSGNVRINTDINSGSLNMSGEAYFEELYVTGEDGAYEKVVPQKYDEPVFFTQKLNPGRIRYEIDLPKTFGSKPSIQTTLLNDNGETFLNYYISDINRDSFLLNLDQLMTGVGYSLQVQASVQQIVSIHQTKLQSFSTGLHEGHNSYQIFFPEEFNRTPVINLTLESKQTRRPTDFGLPGQTLFEDSYYYLFTDFNQWKRVDYELEQRASGSSGDREVEGDFLYICTGQDFWAKINVSGSDFMEINDIDLDGYHTSGDYTYVYSSEQNEWKEFQVYSWPYETTHSTKKYTLSNIDQQKFTLNFDEQLKSKYDIHVIAAR
jgi:hypothetical protein